MDLKNSQLNKLIVSVEKSVDYLEEQTDLHPDYSEIVDLLNSTNNNLKTERKPVIKILSPSVNLGLDLLQKCESNSVLRMLYNFQVIEQIENAVDVVGNTGMICFVYYARQNIILSHRNIITLASQNNLKVAILVVQSEKNPKYSHILQWLTDQSYNLEEIVLPLNKFFDSGDRQNIELLQSFFSEQNNQIQTSFITQQAFSIVTKLEHFFQNKINRNRKNIIQIQNNELRGKIAHQYRQTLNQNINNLNQELKHKIASIKQNINHSRNDYLNLFMSDGWLFELQQIIQSSETKISSESDNTYLYLTIDNRGKTEYLHSYILGMYRQKVDRSLQSQWSKINYDYGDGGIAEIVQKINLELSQIDWLDNLETEPVKIVFTVKTEPKLNLNEIIDLKCLKLNSRIIFDYKYTESSWFKLSILMLVGVGIYIVTKLFFDRGIYIGLIIFVFQLVNILTGRSIKKLRLKQQQKELQRTVNSRYQTLIRSIVERLIQTLIVAVDREEKQYRQQLKAIAQVAQQKLDSITKKIDECKAKSDRLKQDREKILSWFD